MSNKDLINLGYSPDSGTGDSARRGGEKINNLFADVYTQMGDNPVGQDPSQPFYGYRRKFYEYEYKVGELHPAGRFIPIEFKTDLTKSLSYDSEWGWGYDNTGTLVDTDGDGIPDIYRDSEWYFLSRGEKVDINLAEVDSERQVHLVLPLGVPGDMIVVRDGYSTWDRNIFLNVWTTPYDFQSVDQVTEWQEGTGYNSGVGYPDSDTLSVFDPIAGVSYKSNWYKVAPSAAIQSVFPKLSQPFALSRTTNPYQGLSPTYLQNKTRYQLEFLFTSYEEGWLVRQVVLDAADLSAVIDSLAQRVDGIDSDLSEGIFVTADSDFRHKVPLLRRTNDGREVHGAIKFIGDDDAIETSIDSDDIVLRDELNTDNPDAATQPYTTTIKWRLKDNVKIKDSLYVGGDLSAGQTFTVGHGDEVHFTVDSDLTMLDNKLQVHEIATFDSDVYINGQLFVEESSIFNSDVRFNKNVIIAGDATAIDTQSLRIRDNLITLSKDNNNAGALDTGIIFQRYDQTNNVNTPLVASDTVYNTTLFWQEANDQFVFGETVTSDSDLTVALEKTYATISRDNVFFNNDLEIGGTLQVNDTLTVDSDLLNFTDSDGSSIFKIERLVLDRTYDEGDQSKNINDNTEYTVTVNGNTVLGRDSDDVVVFNSRIMSNLIPYGPELYNLGDSDNPWRDLHLAGNTIHLGSIKLSERDGTLYIYDSDFKRIGLDGADGAFDNFIVDSDLIVGGTTSIRDLLVAENALFDSDVNIIGNLTVGDHVELGGHVRMLESLTVDSDVFFSADLRVDSDLIVKGQSTFGEQVRIDDTLYVADKAYFDSDVEIFGTLDIGDDLWIQGKGYIRESLEVDSDVLIAGELTVNQDLTVDGSLFVDGNGYFDSDVAVFGNFEVGDHSILKGHVTMKESLTVDSDVVFSADLRVDSDVIIKGELYVGENVEIHDTIYVKGRATFDSDVYITGAIRSGQEVTFADDVLFLDNATFDSDVVIRGSLTVNGATTTVTAANLAVGDNFIVLNRNQTSPINDTGIIFTRYDSDNVSASNWNAVFEWDETADKFVLGETDNSGIDFNPSLTMNYLNVASGTTTWYDSVNAPRVVTTYGDINTHTVTGDLYYSVDSDIVLSSQRVTVGSSGGTGPFVFDITGAIDPDGLNRPTLGGDGTGIIDGGTF